MTMILTRKPFVPIVLVMLSCGLAQLVAKAAQPPASSGRQSKITMLQRPDGKEAPAFEAGGWVWSSPEQEGMDPLLLQQAADRIKNDCPTRFSLLVARNGRLVFEGYFHGSHENQANNIKSISKSILSVLTGIACDEGLLTGVDQKLDEFFPQYFRAGDDPRKHDITLEHLLTMTAGFEWVENGPVTHSWISSRDWHRFTIESRLISSPGEVFNYNTALTHLLSGILTKVSGMSTRDFATSRLFAPLGMTCVYWSQDPLGYYFGGSEVWLTARDLARFGQLFLDRGRWEGRQIVSEQWLRDSSRLRIRTAAAGWEFGDYGYLWWKKTINGYPVTLCSGYGGQNIFLVPDLDLVMVTTAQSDIYTPYAYYLDPYNLMANYVLPSVKAGPPEIAPGGITHLPDGGARLAAGAFARVAGREFSLADITWADAMPADGGLPDGIGGVRVFLSGRVAHPSSVRNDEVQFLVPADLPAGNHVLEIRTPQGRAYSEVEVVEFAPAVYTSVRDGRRWAGLGAVRPGTVVELKASGLGPAVPPAPLGMQLDTPRPLAVAPEVLVDGWPVEIVLAELASAGCWRLVIRLPDRLPPGPVTLQLRADGVLSQEEAWLEVVTRIRPRRRER